MRNLLPSTGEKRNTTPPGAGKAQVRRKAGEDCWVCVLQLLTGVRELTPSHSRGEKTFLVVREVAKVTFIPDFLFLVKKLIKCIIKCNLLFGLLKDFARENSSIKKQFPNILRATTHSRKGRGVVWVNEIQNWKASLWG